MGMHRDLSKIACRPRAMNAAGHVVQRDRARSGLMVALTVFAVTMGCGRSESGGVGDSGGGGGRDRPNVVWVVWDTVRADHMSLYGYEKPTTSRLDAWAEGARVYENCISTASYTVPSHASMFTGLLPSEHGAHNYHLFLDDQYETIAELFQRSGYQTYLFSANPHISVVENFNQGFDVTEHPWDEQYRQDALDIVRKKSLGDQSSELQEKLRSVKISPWHIKACGKLAQKGVENWLAQREPNRPFFIFLNYMEAHRPFIPPRRFREDMMTPEQVERSYQVDRSWVPMWSYTFGLKEYSDEELAVMAATYDACLAELDAMFEQLLRVLGSTVDLDDTVIVLTADHGEHLGEHHMMDHQYSVYNPLLHVPLVVSYPKRFPPGRDANPVVNYDLFPTLLELAGLNPPPKLESQAVSLLAPVADRIRLAEYPAALVHPFKAVRPHYPNWDPMPWTRVLRALYHDQYKFIWSSDQRHELYNLRDDPKELRDLLHEQSQLRVEMGARLNGLVAKLTPPPTPQSTPPMSEDMRKLLRNLGYVGQGGGDDAPAGNSGGHTWPTLPMPDPEERR